MKNPRLTAEITPAGFTIELENWDGVTNVMIEHLHYAIVKKSQVHRATKLGALHASRMKAEAAKNLEEQKSKLPKE